MDPKTAASLSLVIPCYNEALRLPLEPLQEWVCGRPSWRWIFVNDGSTDRTGETLEAFAAANPNVHALQIAHNVGKAEAVRQGVFWALGNHSSEWVGYLDADLATPLEEFGRIFDEFSQQSRLDAVFGSRVERLGAQIERIPSRHYLGRGAATAVKLLLGLPVYDTQCGAKFFRARAAAQVFADPFFSRWLFDVEIVARFRNALGVAECQQRLVEAPLLEWFERGGSKVKPIDLLRLPFELVRLHWLYNLRKQRPPTL